MCWGPHQTMQGAHCVARMHGNDDCRPLAKRMTGKNHMPLCAGRMLAARARVRAAKPLLSSSPRAFSPPRSPLPLSSTSPSSSFLLLVRALAGVCCRTCDHRSFTRCCAPSSQRRELFLGLPLPTRKRFGLREAPGWTRLRKDRGCTVIKFKTRIGENLRGVTSNVELELI